MAAKGSKSTSLKTKFAEEHNWTWFDMVKGDLFRVGYSDVNRNKTHYYKWQRFANTAKGVIGKQVRAKGVDWKAFKSRAVDGLWELRTMQVHYKLVREIAPPRPASSRNAAIRPAAGGPVYYSDDEVLPGMPQDTATIQMNIMHKTAGGQFWKYRSAQFADSKQAIRGGSITAD